MADARTRPQHARRRVRRRWFPVLVVAVLLFASCIRATGLWFGLPYIYHYDEGGNFAVTQQMVRDADWNPHGFAYGSLFFEVHTLPSIAADLLDHGNLPRLDSPVAGTSKAPQPWVVVLDRLISLSFSVGITGLAMVLGWLLTQRRGVALLAGFLAAVSPIVVDYGRLMTPDTQASFFVIASLCAAVLILQRGKTANYVMAGAFAGLATATKYNTAIVLFSSVLAHALRVPWKRFLQGRLFLVLAAFILAFVVTVPAVFLDFSHLIAGIRSELHHYETGHPGAEGDSFGFYLTRIWLQEGPVVLFAPLALLCRRHIRSIAVVGLFVLGYFALIAHYTVHFERTLLPLEAPLLVLAAVGIFEAAGRLGHALSRARYRTTLRLPALAIVLVIVSIPLAHSSADALRLTHDERSTAQRWISQHVPAGERVVLEAWSPWVDTKKYTVFGENVVGALPLAWFAQHNIGYIVLTERQFGQLLAYPQLREAYRALFSTFPTVAVFNQGHPFVANARQNQVDFWDNRIFVLDVRERSACTLSRCGPPVPIDGVIPAAQKRG